jgi:hypothetical protein
MDATKEREIEVRDTAGMFSYGLTYRRDGASGHWLLRQALAEDLVERGAFDPNTQELVLIHANRPISDEEIDRLHSKHKPPTFITFRVVEKETPPTVEHECLFSRECHSESAKRDPNNAILFGGRKCQARYYEARRRVDQSKRVHGKLYEELWVIHVCLTRQVIVASFRHSEALSTIVDELLQNQADLGKMLGLLYGKEFGEAATGLLKEHIVGAKRIIDDFLKTPPDTNTASLTPPGYWLSNGLKLIAALGSKLNPKSDTSRTDSLVEEVMHHLNVTYAEIVAQALGDTDLSLAIYDRALVHIRHFAALMVDIVNEQHRKT